MGNRVRLIGYGVLVWTLSLAATVFGYDYLRCLTGSQLNTGLTAGLVWMAISIVIDLPIMLSPPISTPFTDYVADIGLTCLMIPVITTGIGAAFAHASRPA